MPWDTTSPESITFGSLVKDKNGNKYFFLNNSSTYLLLKMDKGFLFTPQKYDYEEHGELMVYSNKELLSRGHDTSLLRVLQDHIKEL